MDSLTDEILKNKSENYLKMIQSSKEFKMIDDEIIAVVRFDDEDFYKNEIIFQKNFFDLKKINLYPKNYKFASPIDKKSSIIFVYKDPYIKFRFILIVQILLYSLILFIMVYWIFILRSKKMEAFFLFIDSLKKGDEKINFTYDKDLEKVYTYVIELIKNKDVQIEKANDMVELLRKQNLSLKEKDLTSSNVIENISHELKTPLTKIKGYLDYIYSGKMGELQTSQKDALTVVIKNVNTILEQIEKIIKYARSEYLYLEKEIFKLDKILKEIIDSYIPMAEEKGLNISYDISKLQTPIYADKNALMEAFENILNNSLKFTPKDGNISIVGYEKMDEGKLYAVIRFEDTGIGIPADRMDKIFNRFYQVEQMSSKKYPGMGLGLTIAKTIISEHKGDIVVSSIVGKGTTVKVILPIVREGGENEG